MRGPISSRAGSCRSLLECRRVLERGSRSSWRALQLRIIQRDPMRIWPGKWPNKNLQQIILNDVLLFSWSKGELGIWLADEIAKKRVFPLLQSHVTEEEEENRLSQPPLKKKHKTSHNSHNSRIHQQQHLSSLLLNTRSKALRDRFQSLYQLPISPSYPSNKEKHEDNNHPDLSSIEQSYVLEISGKEWFTFLLSLLEL